MTENKKTCFIFLIIFLFIYIACVPEIPTPDIVPPELAITSHASGEYVMGTISIEGNASDNEGLSKVEISFDAGKTFITVSGSQNWSYSLDTTTFDDGNISIAVRALDNSELADYKFLTLIIDNLPPDDIVITTPENNAKVNGVLTIAGTTSDALAVEKVEIKIGSDDYVLASGTTAWSYTFDTTTYAENIYPVIVKATDISGNSSTSSINIDIDQSSDLPTVVIINPEDNQKISGFVSIVGTANDDDGVQKVEIQIDAEAYELASGTNTWSMLWDTTTVTEGIHTITLKVTDIYDTEGTELTITVDVDQTIPSINITFPEVGSYVEGTIDITGTASDNIGIEKVEVSNDETSVYSLATGTTDWSYSLDTTTLMDGAHTLYARVIDTTGLMGVTSQAITVDNTDPIISISYPPDGELLSGVITVQGTADDVVGVQKVEVKFGPVSYQEAEGTTTWSYDFNTASLANGFYTVIARVTDFAGNTNTSSIDIIIDQNFPTVDSIQADGVDLNDNDNIKGNSVSLTGTVSDIDGLPDIAGVKIQIDANPYQDCSFNVLTGDWDYTLDTTAYTNDTHIVNIKVTDSVGGYSVLTRNVVFDNENPVVSISNPSDNADIAAVVLITGTASDNSDIQSLVIQIDNGGAGAPYELDEDITANILNGYWSYAWDTDALPFNLSPPSHPVKLTVTDLAGNSSTTTINLNKTANAPSINITSHSNGAYVKSSITVEGTTSATAGVNTVEVSIDAGAYQTATDTSVPLDWSTWSYDIDTTSLSEGLHTIRAQVIDTNLVYCMAEINVTVDNIAPTINITYPTNANIGENAVYGIIDVTGTASDTNLDLIQIDVDGGGYNDATGTDSYSYSWDTATVTGVAKNGVIVTAKAIDKAGNETSTNATVDAHPHIESLSKYSAIIGETISIIGDNFSATSDVRFDDNASGILATVVTYVDSTQLDVEVPVGATSGDLFVITNSIDSNGVHINIWSIELIPSSNNGQHSSIVLDGSDNIYYGFVRGGGTKTLDFSKYDGSSWTTVNSIDSNTGGGPSPQYTSTGIALPNVYIAYYHAKTSLLKLAKSTDSGASFPTLVSIESDGTYPSLAVYHDGGTGEDIIYISYYDSINGNLKLAKSIDSGATFSTEILDSEASVGLHTSIALDSGNHPHISYYDSLNRNLKYIYWDNSSGLWKIKVVDTGTVGEYTSIAIGSDDSIHISYYDGNFGDLKYAKADTIGGDFTTEIADATGIVGWYTSITVNSSNKPLISYYDFTNQYIKYAEKPESEWDVFEVPETEAIVQSSTSIYVDSNNLQNIGYASASGAKLTKYLP